LAVACLPTIQHISVTIKKECPKKKKGWFGHKYPANHPCWMDVEETLETLE